MDPSADGSIKNTKLTDPELMGRLGAPGHRPIQRLAIACYGSRLAARLSGPVQLLGAPWQIQLRIVSICVLGSDMPTLGICEPMQRFAPSSLSIR